jgi:ATP-dependent Lhr-like helicase
METFQNSFGHRVILNLMNQKGFKPFRFQEQVWEKMHAAESGLVNAPTGCGKTYSVFLGALISFINQYPDTYTIKKNNGLQLLWITPLKALANDIAKAMETVISELGLQWKLGVRNGDTTVAERQKQKNHVPEILLITPESLHLLLATKNHPSFFKSLQFIAVDEWHELLGSKRGVQAELAIARLVGLAHQKINEPAAAKELSVWGISATIGNLNEARDVLLSPLQSAGSIIRSEIGKKTEIHSILPDTIENFPWAGHLGIKLIDKLLPIIRQSTTTLIFINTRGMSEIWYQALLTAAPELAGVIALHHGSIEHDLRLWVENALHTTQLKVVVCTASLDLGVDFRPVETVIQVGSPKGISRFLQRAGRSGHQPDAISKIYFLPTHSLELLEAVALKNALKDHSVESKEPLRLCFDVLIQYLCTLAVGDGFDASSIFNEIKSTFCFRDLTETEFTEVLHYITKGGRALQEYDEFRKVERIDGMYLIKNRRTAMQHRLYIGTIVSDTMLKVKWIHGGYLGVIEEWFISRLSVGDVFTLAGRTIELAQIKDMTVLVKKSNSKKPIIPSWMGGRMSLTANLGKKLREVLGSCQNNTEAEMIKLAPLFDLQSQWSAIPAANELLIEHIETNDGFHLFVYPFEGRLVHEAMAAILAYRISKMIPISFSFAMNDYGFELLSNQPIPLDDSNVYELFSPDHLFTDMQRSVNHTEMAKRKFRNIAVIGGLIFQGYPGEQKKARHLQSSASLLYQVLKEYEPDNLLLKQAYAEVFEQQMEETRLRDMLQRIQKSKVLLRFPAQLTPFSFPIKADSLREQLSSEKLIDRVLKMQAESMESIEKINKTKTI